MTLSSYSAAKTPIVSFQTNVDSTAKTITVASDEKADYPLSYDGSLVSSFTLSVPKSQQTNLYAISLYGPSAASQAKKVKSFSVSPSKISSLKVGASQSLKVTALPSQSDFQVNYTSLNPDIASVSITGVVTGIGLGNTKILVKIPAEFTAAGSELTQEVSVVVSNEESFTKEASSLNQEQLQAASGTPVLPSTGTQNILVIPVSLTDYATNATAANLQQIRTTFFGKSEETSWESLASYYAKSSYGKLTLTGKVTDWFDCGYSSSQLTKLTGSGTNAEYYDPTWTVLEKAVEWYKKSNSDIAAYDNNKDGILDGVWLVYSAPHFSQTNGLSEDLFWAYTYWDYDALELNPSSNNPLAVNYCWASYDFASEGYGENGFDAHTYIHETGHLLGLDDYYVSNTLANTKNYGPMGGVDMMDYNIIDHNAYSKFAFGWEEPYLVSGGCEITLKPAASSGESILLPTGDGWNGSAFDEYLLLEYYTPTGLNAKDALAAYPGNGVQGFEENGVRIYHVDARMAKENSSGFVGYTDTLVSNETYYTAAAHSNSNGYNVTNSSFRLIQELDCTKKRNFDTDSDNGDSIVADDSSLFHSGSSFAFADYAHSFPKTTMNDGTAFPYQIHFGEQNAEGALITISLA